MNNRLRLTQASLIATLGILLCLITVYVPMLSILSIAIPVPYAIIGTLTDNKYSILSLIVTFLILMFTVNPLYSVSLCIMSIVPGLFIGSAIRNNVQEAIMENAGIILKEGFKASDIVDYINNMLPTMLFLQGIIVSFIVYALEIFVLKRIKMIIQMKMII